MEASASECTAGESGSSSALGRAAHASCAHHRRAEGGCRVTLKRGATERRDATTTIRDATGNTGAPPAPLQAQATPTCLAATATAASQASETCGPDGARSTARPFASSGGCGCGAHGRQAQAQRTKANHRPSGRESPQWPRLPSALVLSSALWYSLVLTPEVTAALGSLRLPSALVLSSAL